MAIFGGKIPHSVGIVPGGVTAVPTVDKITALLWKVKELQDFVDNVYLPDVLAIAGVYATISRSAQAAGICSPTGVTTYRATTPISPGERGFSSRGRYPPTSNRRTRYSRVTEGVKYSWYEDFASAKHPSQGETKPHSAKRAPTPGSRRRDMAARYTR